MWGEPQGPMRGRGSLRKDWGGHHHRERRKTRNIENKETGHVRKGNIQWRQREKWQESRKAAGGKQGPRVREKETKRRGRGGEGSAGAREEGGGRGGEKSDVEGSGPGVRGLVHQM